MVKKQDFILVCLLLLVPGRALAASHLPAIYPCADPLHADATCSYDPTSAVRLGGKVKIRTREIYPSVLPPNRVVLSLDIVMDCAKTTYQIVAGTEELCASCAPGTIVPSSADREVLGSIYESLFGAVCSKKK